MKRLIVPIITSLSIVCSGCFYSKPKMSVAQLQNSDPAIRIQAIKWAGENKLEMAVPDLVDLLADEDKAVRFYAIGALRRITGTDHGYDFKANAQERSQAIERWREELEKNQPDR
ncbi:MAG: HEAT repeat domain-containing protein [Sedimentisphaerales bacterium]|nr:HEAT repeat domain-containing protein [Sedimentisphaerales bacterium]